MLNLTQLEKLKIMELLELAPSYLHYLETQLQSAYNQYGEAAQTRIRELLDQYDTFEEMEDTLITTTVETGNIKKLDVIEYFGSSDSNSNVHIDNKVAKIKNKLRNLLQISIGGVSTGYARMVKG